MYKLWPQATKEQAGKNTEEQNNMVGTWCSFWGPAYVQVQTVSFREGN